MLSERSPNLPPPAKKRRVKTDRNQAGRTATAKGTAAELDVVQTVLVEASQPTGEQQPAAPVPDELVDPRLLEETIDGVLKENGLSQPSTDR